MIKTRLTSFVAGVLIANSSPHLATLITGRVHMTPLAGRNSGPLVNGAWAAVNLAAGVALLQPSRRCGDQRWDSDLPAFELGYLTFAGWMTATETFFPKSNWANHR